MCGHSPACELPRGCQEPCSRQPSQRPCSGLCGHRCPSAKRFRCPITLEAVRKGRRAYCMPDCGCAFDLAALDRWMEEKAQEPFQSMDKQRRLLRCPSCAQPITSAARYSALIRDRHYDPRCELRFRELTAAEFKAINAALQYDRLGRGHWWRCDQGHLFNVGNCGNPAELGRCIECRAMVGRELSLALTTKDVHGRWQTDL